MKKVLSFLIFLTVLALILLGVIKLIPNVNLNNIINKQKYEYKNNIDALKIGRASLTDEEKKVYDAIYKSVENIDESIQITPFPYDLIEKVYTIYLNDNPEHFYIKNLSYKLVGNNIHAINFEYIYQKEVIEKKITDIQKESQTVISNAKTLNSDYDKSKYIHDYILQKTKYVQSNTESIYNIEGVFLHGQAVCQGYGKAYQYLMNLLGYKSLYVRGFSRNENHGWNLVELENAFYNVDTTWDDIESNSINIIDYTYFHVTDEEIYKDHILDAKKNGPLPKADSNNLSYYKKNNAIVSNHKNENAQMSQIFINAYKNADKAIYIKFETDAALNSFLKDNAFINSLMNQAKAYSANKNSQTKGFSYIKNEYLKTVAIFIG